MLMAACGCHIEIKLVTASTGYIFTVFIVMSGWFLLASAIVQYQRKIKLLKLKNINFIDWLSFGDGGWMDSFQIGRPR